MKKYFCILTFICFAVLFFIPSVNVYAEDLSDSVNDILGNLDLSEIQKIFNDNNLFDLDFYTLISDIINGKKSLDFTNVFSYVISCFFDNGSSLLPYFVSIIAVTILTFLFNNIKNSCFSEDLSKIIGFISYIFIFTVIFALFSNMFSCVSEVIGKLSNLSDVISPVLLTLMVSSNGSYSALIYRPAVAFLSNGIISVILYVILPLISVLAVIGFVNGLADNIRLKKFFDFFSSVIKWILGILAVVYGCFLTSQGISALIVDGVSVKTAKYTISSLVPIVGGLLKDSLDLIIAGSILIKNAVGIVFIIMIFAYVLSPLIKILIFSLFLKLLNAIIEPLSNDKTCETLSLISKSCTYLTVVLLLVGLLFFITVLMMMISASGIV